MYNQKKEVVKKEDDMKKRPEFKKKIAQVVIRSQAIEGYKQGSRLAVTKVKAIKEKYELKVSSR